MSFLPSCAPRARSVHKSQQRPLCLLGLDLKGELPDTVLENLGPLQEEYLLSHLSNPMAFLSMKMMKIKPHLLLTMKVEQGSGEQRDLLLGHDSPKIHNKT